MNHLGWWWNRKNFQPPHLPPAWFISNKCSGLLAPNRGRCISLPLNHTPVRVCVCVCACMCASALLFVASVPPPNLTLKENSLLLVAEPPLACARGIDFLPRPASTPCENELHLRGHQPYRGSKQKGFPFCFKRHIAPEGHLKLCFLSRAFVCPFHANFKSYWASPPRCIFFASNASQGGVRSEECSSSAGDR